MKSEFLVARSRVLRRLRLNALSALEPAEPIRRYERENPGELIHLDIKKLGRIGSTCTAREIDVLGQYGSVSISMRVGAPIATLHACPPR